MRIAIISLLALFMVTPVLAGPPMNGTYTSTDLGGTMLTGRYSESWAGPEGRLQVGNTINVLSWNGATLGTQWWMYCAEIQAPPMMLVDTVVNGDGFRQWLATYSGGILVLDGNGPWGDGSDPSYTALFDSYSEQKTELFVGGEVVTTLTTVQLQSTIVGYSDLCVVLSIHNEEEFGSTDDGPAPLDYPTFLAPTNCAPTRTHGAWGVAKDFTLTVDGCTVATEETSWGAIKVLYE